MIGRSYPGCEGCGSPRSRRRPASACPSGSSRTAGRRSRASRASSQASWPFSAVVTTRSIFFKRNETTLQRIVIIFDEQDSARGQFRSAARSWDRMDTPGAGAASARAGAGMGFRPSSRPDGGSDDRGCSWQAGPIECEGGCGSIVLGLAGSWRRGCGRRLPWLPRAREGRRRWQPWSQDPPPTSRTRPRLTPSKNRAELGFTTDFLYVDGSIPMAVSRQKRPVTGYLRPDRHSPAVGPGLNAVSKSNTSGRSRTVNR